MNNAFNRARFKSVAWYIGIGVFNAGLYVILGKALTALGLGPSVAGACAFLPCVALSYFGHKHKTFQSKTAHQQAVPRFVMLTLIGLAFGAIFPRIAMLLGVPIFWGLSAVSVAVPIANLIAMRYWIFQGGRSPTSAKSIDQRQIRDA